MSKTVSIRIEVGAKIGHFVFEIIATQTLDRSEQTVPPDFYTENDAKVPEGEHWELAIRQSPTWGRVKSDGPIHIHHPKGVPVYFVCFTGQVSSEAQARAVVRQWCLGTVYTLKNGHDFADLAIPEGSDLEMFLRDNFDIFVME